MMRRPVAVLIPVMAAAARPRHALHRREAGPSGRLGHLPPVPRPGRPGTRSSADFPAGETSPIDLLVTASGDPLSSSNASALAEYAARVATLTGVTRVDGPFSLADPSGPPLPTSTVATLLAQPPTARPAALNAPDRRRRSRLDGAPPGRQPAGRHSRGPDARPDHPLARSGAGLRSRSAARTRPRSTSWPHRTSRCRWQSSSSWSAMAAMLLLQFGSVVLPVKAVVMTLLSLTASFGALVWIFQDGNLSGCWTSPRPGSPSRSCRS